jgi:DNA ligase-associated metallophosphoesterase
MDAAARRLQLCPDLRRARTSRCNFPRSPMSAASLPLPFDRPPRVPCGQPALCAVVGGERVVLHAERALEWPAARTLFVADVHLGKAAAFRAGGVPLPRGTTATDLARLDRLLAKTSAARLVVLGDFLHAKAGRVAALAQALVAWRLRHRDVEVLLVRGNHDASAGDPPREWQVTCVDEPYALAPFLACHHATRPPSGYALCGHVHPGIRIASAGEAARVPCFLLGRERAILPAFGRFTGLADIAPAHDERIVAIAGAGLFELPALSRTCNG